MLTPAAAKLTTFNFPFPSLGFLLFCLSFCFHLFLFLDQKRGSQQPVGGRTALVVLVLHGTGVNGERVCRGGRSRLNTLAFNLEETPVAERNPFTARITAGTAQKIPSPWQSEPLADKSSTAETAAVPVLQR